MSYRIAGIDVHKKMLAVVVADVAVEGEFQFERRRFGTTADHLRLLTECADRAGGRGSGDGIDGAVLEAGLGGAGTVLATDLPEARERRPDVGKTTSGACGVQSRAAGAQEGFP
jgi:hypothetical protein